jgi:hypothetical protein
VRAVTIVIPFWSNHFSRVSPSSRTKWLSILDNSFTEFDVGEYVALLLSEEYTEGGLFVPPVYIHARVKHKINNQSSCQINEVRRSLQKYEVYVGNYQTDVRAAYDLYKFNRNNSGTLALSSILDIS